MGYRVSPTLSTVQARLLTSMLHATRWPPGRGISPHINRKGTSDHFIAHRGAALEVVGVLQRPSKMPDAASSRATPLKRDEAAHLYTLASQLPMDELDAAFLPPRPEPCMRVLLADLDAIDYLYSPPRCSCQFASIKGGRPCEDLAVGGKLEL